MQTISSPTILTPTNRKTTNRKTTDSIATRASTSLALLSIARRRGFSLLEVLLSMALAVVLMGMISWAFQFYTSDMDGAHLEIQQTQLASAIIQMIEDDLRSTLYPEPIDLSALEAVLSAQGGGQAASNDPSLAAAGVTPEIEMTETADLTTGTAILETPGLIGNQFQIQIDASKLPRLEEYNQMMDQDTANLDDVPSDLKTVTYFVQAPGAGVTDPLDAINGADGTAPDDAMTGGLVRRVLDREATTYAAQNGNLSQLSQTGVLLAPEVTSIEFQYWDGITWLLDWSTDEMGELPLAIRVNLTMTSTTAVANGMSPNDEGASRVFSHVVRLPMANPIEEEEEVEEETSGAAL